MCRLLQGLDAAFFRAIVRDSALSGIAAGLARVFVLVLSIVVSRAAASEAQFGVFSSALLFVQLAAMLASLGLSQSATQAVAIRADDPGAQDLVVRTFVVVMVVVGTFSVATIALAAPVLARALNASVPTSIVRATSVLVLLQLFAGGLEGILRGKLSFRALPASVIIAWLLALLVGYPLIARFGCEGGLITLAIFSATQVAVLLLAVDVRMFGPVLAPAQMRSLLGSIAAPVFLSGLFWNVAMMVPPLLLLRTASGLHEIALWNAASQLRTLISFTPVVVVNASMPHLVAQIRARSLSRVKSLAVLALPVGVAVAPYLPVVMFSGRLMSAYGRSYAAHGALLVLVVTYVLLQVLGVGLFAFVVASGRIWRGAVLNLAWCITVLGLSSRTIANGGVYALAKLYLISYIPVDAVLIVFAVRAVIASRMPENGLPRAGVSLET